MENKKRKVLVIDDDENLRLVLTDKLVASDFEVVVAANGKEGLEKALELHPDAILLDILMPVMDGWEMLGNLRKDKWGKDAKVIMLTGVEDAEAVAKAVQGGSFVYILKTKLNINEIADQVRSML
jgi:CheY-like chemotaxis protein